jgi:hypothetical protein
MNKSTALIMLTAITALTIFILYIGLPAFKRKTGNGPVYKRMIVGGIIGGILVFTALYLLLWCNDTINPVTGLGLIVLSTLGIVVGTLLGTLRRNKHTQG